MALNKYISNVLSYWCERLNYRLYKVLLIRIVSPPKAEKYLFSSIYMSAIFLYNFSAF